VAVGAACSRGPRDTDGNVGADVPGRGTVRYEAFRNLFLPDFSSVYLAIVAVPIGVIPVERRATRLASPRLSENVRLWLLPSIGISFENLGHSLLGNSELIP